MKRYQTVIARKSLEKKLAPVREMKLEAPRGGWIKAIRESLGMSTRQLAERMGVARSRVTTIEKAEITGATTLKTLQETAEALNCKFVYAFVPVKPLDDILLDQARKKTAVELTRLTHTMQLENQKPSKSALADELNRMVKDVIEGPSRHLWDDK